MLTCRDIARTVSSEELERAGFGRRTAIRLHYFMCPPCRRYAAQIRAIGECARQIFRNQTVDKSTLERLRGALLRAANPDGKGTA
jgi:hypothetical protein